MKLMWRFVVAFVAVITLTGASIAGPSGNSVLRGSVPAWAKAHNYAGPADPNGNVAFRVYLGWQNADAAEALARAVSDPHSAQYGQYLTPQQFRKQFAPSQGSVAAV